jgi:tetratricopeptide (TPR) repeat protein
MEMNLPPTSLGAAGMRPQVRLAAYYQEEETLQLSAPCRSAAHEASQFAAQLNNVAVSFLQSKSEDEALDMLYQAWKDYQVAVFCQQQSLEQTLVALWNLNPALSLSILMRPSAFMMEIDNHQPTIKSVSVNEVTNSSIVSVPDDLDLTASPSNFFSVYNRAFVFREDTASTFEWLLRRQSILPAVLLYNIALIYHRRALQQVQANEYHRALHFYKLSLNVVEDHLNAGLHSSDYCLLKLALYNNIGYLASHFCNENETIIFGGRMLATFASVDCTRLLSKEEYVFFYMNLLFLLNRHPLCAPAA